MTQTVTTILAALVVLGQLGVLGVVIALLMPKVSSAQKLVKWVGDHALQISFTVAVVATGGSLYYSEIAGYNPCKMCWIQRIFMYPLVILFGMGWKKRDHDITLYGLVLAIIGAGIAFYHYLLQLGLVPELSCSAIGISESCSARFVMTFGYITIPMMALTGFAMIIVSIIAYRRVHTARV